MEIKWQKSTGAPFRNSNQAVVISDEVCMTASRLPRVASYNAKSRKWQQFKCIVEGASIVVFHNQVVLVGGKVISDPNRRATSQITAWNVEKQIWTYPYPPMHTARCYASVTSYKTHLVVAGGWDYVKGKIERYDSVEVLDSATSHWTIVEPLPLSSVYEMTSTVLNDTWYS